MQTGPAGWESRKNGFEMDWKLLNMRRDHK